MYLSVLSVVLVVRYLSVTEFAERAGLSINSVKAYSQIPGRLPEPDAMIGRVKGWLPETVDAWAAKRASL
ncbi:hypothetical protein ASJ79_25110 [Mycobacterium sp. NAZ190054]|nr:hypothetical protein ASJ79_25110 [Mycobacterium sp. NAZ190054]